MFAAIQRAIAATMFALSIVPQLVDLVRQFEIPGHGPEKLKAVVDIIRASWALVPDDVLKAIGGDKVEAFVVKAIEIIVEFMNATGVFATSKK